MARPSKNGIYDFRIRAQKCNSSCKDYASCRIRLDPSGKCKKRDKKEYYVKYVHIKKSDGTVKRKEIYGKTIEELSEKVASFERKREDASSGEGNRENAVLTLGQWCDVWIKDYVNDAKMKPTSCKFYKSLIHYLPLDLRNKAFSVLKPLDFERHFTFLKNHGGKEGKGLSGKTLRSYRTMLIGCVERAVENGIVTANVVRKTSTPLMNPKEISFLEKDDIYKLMRTAESGKYYVGLEKVKNEIEKLKKIENKSKNDICKEQRDIGILYLISQWPVVIRLALESGMRRGEIFGLTWDCVDFLKRKIVVKRNLQGGKLVSPKTKNSIRTITIDAETMKRLNAWKEYQQRYAEEVGDLFDNEMSLLFTNSFGRPVDFDNFRCRYFNKIVSAAGLPSSITFHSMRHTHATQLLASGVDVKTISQRLGHSAGGVAFTLQTYVHALHETDSIAADTMGAILLEGKLDEED